MKLNADAPGQHLAILAIAGVFTALSLIDWAKGPRDNGAEIVEVKGPYALTGETLYDNPKLSWFERYFCKGYQRSGICSYKLRHPYEAVFSRYGIAVSEQPVKNEGIIRYRGSLPNNRALSDKITVD